MKGETACNRKSRLESSGATPLIQASASLRYVLTEAGLDLSEWTMNFGGEFVLDSGGGFKKEVGPNFVGAFLAEFRDDQDLRLLVESQLGLRLTSETLDVPGEFGMTVASKSIQRIFLNNPGVLAKFCTALEGLSRASLN